MSDTIPQDAAMKQCFKCKEWKPATPSFFLRNRANIDGFRTPCKACVNLRKHLLPEFQIDGQKYCIGCSITKPATTEFFVKHPTARDGFNPRCKQCLHPPKQPDPPEDTRRCAICKEIYPATREYFYAQKGKRGGIRHYCKGCSSKKSAAYRNADLEKNHQQQRAMRVKHHDSHIKHLAQYRQKHPEKYITYNRNRAARKQRAEGKHTVQDIQNQLMRQKQKCYYCRKKLTKYHVDHVVPISRGGANSPDNLVITCSFCNQSKHDKLPHEWPQGGRLL